MKTLLKITSILILVVFVFSMWGCASKRPVYRTNPTPLPPKDQTPPPSSEQPSPPPQTEPPAPQPVEPTPPEPPVSPTPAMVEGNILEDFENMAEWNFMGYPDEVTGAVAPYTLEVHDGVASGRLSYNFMQVPNNKTGAAYMVTNKVVPLDAKKIRAWVYGNGSRHWLRIRFDDAKGVTFAGDLARKVDWRDEWRKCSLSLDTIAPLDDKLGAIRPQAPLTLKRIYLVCEPKGLRDQGNIIIDNLTTE